jgi:cell division protein FtsB
MTAMFTFQKKKILLRKISWPLFVCLMLTYLTFHALNGSHGIYALLKEQHRMDFQKQRLAELQKQHQIAAHRVALLSDNSLDLDLLDERARFVLGYAGKDELVTSH